MSDCEDPGVKTVNNVPDAVNVIGENRLYAACEKRKRRDLVTHWDNVRKGLLAK